MGGLTIFGGSSSNFGAAHVSRRPESYGAKGDDGTDDTPAFRAALSSALDECLSTGSNWCAIDVSARSYVFSSSTVKGGTTRGNAQLPLLNREPSDGQKVTVVIRGPGDAGSFTHWQQTVPQRSGAVIRSTLTGQTPDGTWGAPSIIGGPTATLVGGGDFSNVRLVLDGVTIVAPIDPSLIGVDARRCAQFDFGTLAVLANGNPAQLATPTNSNGIGVYAPSINNNDSCNGRRYVCEGFYYGMGFSDHLAVESMAIVYYNTALYINAASGTYVHGARIGYLSAEAGATIIEKSNSTNNRFPLTIDRLDTETQTGTAIKDPSNNLHGSINWASNDGADPTVTGCHNLRIVNDNRDRGAMTAPSVPASTVVTAPVFRDAAVTVSGGTVTAITVDGQATGLTSGTVIVPSGQTISITYSVAPTWRWTLL